MSLYLTKWFRQRQEDGTWKEWSTVVTYNTEQGLRDGYKRLLDDLNNGPHNPDDEWGVSCPFVEAEDKDLAPAAERIQWLRRIRDVRLGKA